MNLAYLLVTFVLFVFFAIVWNGRTSINLTFKMFFFAMSAWSFVILSQRPEIIEFLK